MTVAKRTKGCQNAEMSEQPFWKTTKLSEMTDAQWESLCDGCGRCCLNKLEDWDSGEIHWTNIACSLLDHHTCKCGDYKNRFDTVPDCVKLSPEKIKNISWLPPTCAYRLVEEGKDLHPWHPLISKNADAVHEAGISVRGKIVGEEGLSPEDYEFHLVDWVMKNIE